jgi:hypothetical protein
VNESQFTKDKALLENRAQHFQKLVEEYSRKEREIDSSMSREKSELSTQMKDVSNKYEKVIKEL